MWKIWKIKKKKPIHTKKPCSSDLTSKYTMICLLSIHFSLNVLYYLHLIYLIKKNLVRGRKTVSRT
jgi:hypothetical protein